MPVAPSPELHLQIEGKDLVTSLVLSADGSLLAVATADHLCLYRIKKTVSKAARKGSLNFSISALQRSEGAQCRQLLECKVENITSMAFTARGNALITISADLVLRVSVASLLLFLGWFVLTPPPSLRWLRWDLTLGESTSSASSKRNTLKRLPWEYSPPCSPSPPTINMLPWPTELRHSLLTWIAFRCGEELYC